MAQYPMGDDRLGKIAKVNVMYTTVSALDAHDAD